MNTKLLLAAIFVVTISGVSFAEEKMDGMDHMMHDQGMEDLKAGAQDTAQDTMEAGSDVMAEAQDQAEQAVAAVEVGNTICPVGGEKIVQGKAAKVEYNGKIYNLCCEMCRKDFNNDPEKYIQKIESELTQ